MSGNVRTPVAKFFGRDAELATLAEKLRAGDRLISLCGPGGAGKTRLAMELLRAVESAYAGGVWFCDLSGATALDDVCRAVAEALGVELGSDALAQLAGVIASRGELLLCLDNLEQAVEPSAEAITRWLGASEAAQMVVTTRERLRIDGEIVLEVPPLEGHGDALFVDRATRIGTDVEEADAAAVSRIVAALDHQPLAIELAAARTSVLSIAELAELLPERWALLEHQRRDAPKRHHSVLATLAWSWDLLEPREQHVFAQCALFAGRFDREDAAAVVGDEVLSVLASLRDKSLLRTARDGDVVVMSMFRVMRDFGRARLVELGIDEESRARHAAWVIARCREADGVRALGDLLDDVITVHAWAVEGAGSEACALATDALLAVAPYFEARGPVHAQIARWDALLRLHPTPRGHIERAVLRRMAGRMDEAARDLVVAETMEGELEVQFLIALESSRIDFAAGRLTAARASGERAHALAADLSERELGLAALQLGRLAHTRGEPERAREMYTEALARVRTIGDRREISRALSALGFTLQDLGDSDRAEACFREAITICRELGHRRAEARVQGYLGNVFRSRLDGEGAGREYVAAVATCQAQGDPWLESVYLMDHGILLSALGKPEAVPMFERAVEVADRADNTRCSALSRGHLGALAADAGDIASAEHYFETAATRLVDGHDGQMPAVVALQRHHLTLALVRAGELEADAVAPIRALLSSELTVQSEHMRLARRILARSVDRTLPPDDAIVVAADGGWFRHEARVDLDAHPALAGVLACLGSADQPADVDALFAAGWPGERAVAAARKNRVRVAISTLRKHGLPVTFDRAAKGYRIDGRVVIDPA